MKKQLNKSALLLSMVICCLNLITGQAVRKVLLEEFTTASCGNCPMASKRINAWHEEHPNTSVIMTIHEGSGRDAMSTSTTTAIFNAFHPDGFWFAPAIMIDRTVWPEAANEIYLIANQFNGSADPDLDTIALRQINSPAKVAIQIQGSYDPGSRLLNTTVSATFLEAVPQGNWRINLFLVEDNVVGYPGLGPFKGWDQHCYDPAWANANFPGMFDGTSIIGYPHRHVMRNAMLGNWGIANIIPPLPVVGNEYVTSATLKVDTAYRDNNLSLVAFVASYGTAKNEKYILNVNDIKVSNSFTTDVEDQNRIGKSSFDYIYPLPAQDNVHLVYTLNQSDNIKFIVSDFYGKTIQTSPSNKFSSGRHELTINTNLMASGVYFISMQSSGSSSVKKFIISGK
jgi:hypothetical protein